MRVDIYKIFTSVQWETVMDKQFYLDLEEAFAGTDLLTAIPVFNRGHHPHGKIGNNQVIVDFILSHI